MTSSVTVAVVGALEVAKELGKKGTASDVTMFNTVTEGHAVTLVEPSGFPDKLACLPVVLSMADHVLLVMTELTRPLAETIATVELADCPTTVVIGPAVGAAEVARLLKGGPLESAPRTALDLPSLRALVETWTAPAVDGPVTVPLDHAFPVKGVGAVALGVVRRGRLQSHDRLRLWPTPKSVEVRSIQVHDLDRKEAECGERVGVALKGVEADELERGQVLAPDGTLRAEATLQGSGLARCRYYRGDAGAGAQLHAAIGLQVVPCSVDELSPGAVRIRADRPVAYRVGDPMLLFDLDVPAGPRIVGRSVLSA